MALVLAVRKGFQLKIGTELYEVSSVSSAYECHLQSLTTPDDGQILVRFKDWVNLFDDVWVATGVPQNEIGKVVRLMIDAPKNVAILSGAMLADSRLINEITE